MNALAPRLFFAFTLVAVSYVTSAPAQGVLSKDGKSFKVSSDAKTGASNEVCISSRAQIADGQLRQSEWWVARDVIERQPRWDLLTAEPPFSTHKATALALPKVSALFPEVKEWVIVAFYTRNLQTGGTKGNMYSYPNVWVYEIEFRPKDEKLREKLLDSARVHGLTQVILLDGTIVSPRSVK